jgi:hypothetical protein
MLHARKRKFLKREENMKSKLMVGLTVALCVTGIAEVYGSGGSRGVLEREYFSCK